MERKKSTRRDER